MKERKKDHARENEIIYGKTMLVATYAVPWMVAWWLHYEEKCL